MKTTFKSSWWWASFLTLLGGLGSSFYLMRQHFLILKSGFAGKTLCNINPYVNCDVILVSDYAQIGTLSLAGLGFLFYLYLLGAFIYVRFDKDSTSRVLTLPYLLIILSCLFSLLLAYISLFEIKALCIFCTSLYVVNFLLFFFTKKVIGMNFKEWFKNFARVSWVKSLAYLSIVFVMGGIILHTNHKQFAQDLPQAQLTAYLNSFLKLPEKQVNTDGRPYWGNPDATIVVTEFSDFECPYCKRAAFTLKPLLSKYRDQIKFVFMNYPLDPSCNASITRALHKQACQTAYAAFCSGQQGKFWEYHDKAFDRQPKFHQKSLENIANKLDLNLKQFKECMTDEKTKEFIIADIQEGGKLGVRGTPSVFVNGRPFRPWMSRSAWKQLIEQISKPEGSS